MDIVRYIAKRVDIKSNIGVCRVIALKYAIDIDFVIENLHAKWDWDILSRNPGIKISDIEKYIDLSWSWENIAANPNINIEFVIKYIKKFDGSIWLKNLAKNKGIKMADITKYDYFDWDPAYIVQNPNIDIVYFINNKHLHNYTDLVLMNKGLNMHDIAYLTNNTFHKNVLYNPNINIDYIIDNLYKIDCWSVVSMNPGIKEKDVLMYPDLPWDWNAMSYNRNITMQLVMKNMDKNWNMKYVCASPNITLNEALLLRNFGYDGIEYNVNINLQFMLTEKINPMRVLY
jgi:hypothetical protein